MDTTDKTTLVRNALIATLIVAAVLSAITFVTVHLPSRILAQLQLDKGATLHLHYIGPSRDHFLYITYRVEGDSTIYKVHWRLRGNRIDPSTGC